MSKKEGTPSLLSSQLEDVTDRDLPAPILSGPPQLKQIIAFSLLNDAPAVIFQGLSGLARFSHNVCSTDICMMTYVVHATDGHISISAERSLKRGLCYTHSLAKSCGRKLIDAKGEVEVYDHDGAKSRSLHRNSYRLTNTANSNGLDEAMNLENATRLSQAIRR